VAERVGWSDDVVLVPEAIELRGQAPWVKADIRAEADVTAMMDTADRRAWRARIRTR
jgi:hypothetical protein